MANTLGYIDSNALTNIANAIRPEKKIKDIQI